MSSSEPVFRVRELSKSYGASTVLAGLDFDVHAGECFVILGRSGSGKSVLLRQLNGLEKPDAGTVVFEGTELSALSERELAPYRKRIGMLFQSGALFDSMTVFDNIAYPLREHGDLTPGEVADTVHEKLGLVGLDGIDETMPSELSGGMRKRVALARSLALDPGVVLFDEPTTGLDPMTSATIAHLIDSARNRLDVTSIVVTHDLRLARTVASRLAFLDGGRFRFLGTWEDVDDDADARFTRFLEGRRDDG